jgi:aryl-alcohol dehydrogenase-like predicted oxidoreductase
MKISRRLLCGQLAASSVVPAVATGAAVAAAAPLLTRSIPASGQRLPVIGLGTSGPFEAGADPTARANLKAVLAAHFAAGATVIDTSPMYTTAEAVLGDLLSAEQQAQCFMATKVWTPGAAADARGTGIRQMTTSLQRMRRDKVDLMQVHNLVELDTHLRTLREWREEGRIRYIGITHYTVAAQERLAEIVAREKLDFVQINYSVVTRDAENRLLPLCRDRGVAVLINRAFEDGALFSRVRGQSLPPWAGEFGAASWGQLFLKFVLAHPAVTCVIPATGKLANALDNLAAGRGALPDAAQRERIIAALT